MKNANGTGCVHKLSGNRRKPYAVILTMGTEYDEKTDTYKQKRKYLGYYASQQEARKALALYIDNPYDLEKHDITIDDIWNIVSPKIEKKVSVSRMECYSSAYKYLNDIKNNRIRDVRVDDLQQIIDDCEKKSATKQNIKFVMSKIYEHAIINDYVSKDCSQYVSFEKDAPTIKRVLYTAADVDYLWKNSSRWECAMMLILLYSGMRINEFISNKSDNIDLDAKTITIPEEIAKNDSSARVIPIHSKILPLLEQFKSVGSEWIAVKPNGVHINYKNFMDRENKVLNKELGVKHSPHDARHSFITQARQCGLDNLIIQRIVGHHPDTITQDRYTHLELSELLYQINFVDYE